MAEFAGRCLASGCPSADRLPPPALTWAARREPSLESTASVVSPSAISSGSDSGAADLGKTACPLS